MGTPFPDLLLAGPDPPATSVRPPGRPPTASASPGAPPVNRPPPNVAVGRRFWPIPGFAVGGTGPPGYLGATPRAPSGGPGAPRKPITWKRCCRTTYLADPGICCVRDRTPRLPRCDPPGAPRRPRRPPGRPVETIPSRCCRTPTYLADPGICCVRDGTPRLPRCDPAGAPRRPRRPRGERKSVV